LEQQLVEIRNLVADDVKMSIPPIEAVAQPTLDEPQTN
jgi:hypothetical protein